MLLLIFQLRKLFPLLILCVWRRFPGLGYQAVLGIILCNSFMWFVIKFCFIDMCITYLMQLPGWIWTSYSYLMVYRNNVQRIFNSQLEKRLLGDVGVDFHTDQVHLLLMNTCRERYCNYTKISVVICYVFYITASLTNCWCIMPITSTLLLTAACKGRNEKTRFFH